MIEPKDLYRKLAALLKEIDIGIYDADYLLSVLARLGNSFTRDLHIASSRDTRLPPVVGLQKLSAEIFLISPSWRTIFSPLR